MTSGQTAPVAGKPIELAVPLKPNLPDGVYTVAWRTVSAVDGHLATGRSPSGSVSRRPRLDRAGHGDHDARRASNGAIAGRWLLYLGLVGLLGLAVFGALVAHGSPASVRRVLPIAWLIAAIGTFLVVAFQLGDADVDVGRVFETSFGAGIVARSVPIVIGGVGVLWVWLRRGHERAGLVDRRGRRRRRDDRRRRLQPRRGGW